MWLFMQKCLLFGQSVVAVQSETLSFCEMFIVEMVFGFVF